MTVVLGVHRDPWHDTGAAVIRVDSPAEEPVVYAISQERLCRTKHASEFPAAAIDRCLSAVGASGLRDVDVLIHDYIEVPGWGRDHRVGARATLSDSPRDPAPSHIRASPAEVVCVDHHLAHAACVFYASPFADAAVLVVDGRGSSGSTQSLYRASRRSGLQLLARSGLMGLGCLYSTITESIGFGFLCEGKTMGLAPYGSRTNDIIWPQRRWNNICTDYSEVCRRYYGVASPSTERAALAWKVQQETEDAMLYLANVSMEMSGLSRLCISGGVALNANANARIANVVGTDSLFIHPAASDTGIPLGCALFGMTEVLGKPVPFPLTSPFLGPRYTPDEIAGAIPSDPDVRILERPKSSALDWLADRLASGAVVAWFSGRSEIGPRALGARSILMDPQRAANKDYLNFRVKLRESFRPYGVAILEEDVDRCLEWHGASPYMLMIAAVRRQERSILPAVTHVDGTSRLQTVGPTDTPPEFRRLLECMRERIGVGALLNTSFNVAGAPIVETPEDAVACFRDTPIDILWLDGHILAKRSLR